MSARLAQAILWACRNKTKEKEEKGEEEKEKKNCEGRTFEPGKHFKFSFTM